jgi:hypothetical protein
MKISLPEGNYDAIVQSPDNVDMVSVWNDAILMNEECLFAHFGERTGRGVDAVVPIITYVNVARAAFSLCSVADIKGGTFDPVEFGKRCEAIAREQIDRYRVAFEQAAGRA